MKMMFRLYRNPWTYAVAAGFMLLSVYRVAAFLPQRAIRNDFAHYYLGTRAYLEGGNPYTTDLAPAFLHHGFVNDDFLQEIYSPYPPLFFAFFSPFACLPPNHAFSAWVAFQSACLGAVLFLTYRLLAPQWSARAWYLFCAAVCSSVWVFLHFYFSQLGLTLVLLALAALTLHRSGHHNGANLMIVAAGLLKIFPFLLLPWFLWSGSGALKEKAIRGLVVAALIGASVWITGLGNWIDFLDHSRRTVARDSVDRMANYSLPALVANLGYAAHGFSPSREHADLLLAAATAGGLALIGLIYFFVMIYNRDSDLGFSLISLAILAGSIRTFGHYFVWSIYPLAVAAVRAARRSEKSLLWVTTCYLMLNLAWVSNTNFFINLPLNIFLKILINYIPLYGLLALTAFLASEAKRSRQTPPLKELREISRS